MAKRSYFFWGCLGCGGFVLLIFLIFAAGFGWLVYSTMQYGQEMQAMYVNLKTQYDGIDSQFPYTPPEDGMLPEDRYKEFLEVRKDITAFSEDYLNRFEEIGEKIEEGFESGSFSGVLSGVSSIKEIIETAVKMFPEIGGHHIEILTQHEMSNREYIWLCQTAVGTLSKCQENNHAAGAQIWAEYGASFGEVEEIVLKMSENNQQWDSSDFNVNQIEESVQNVPYYEDNAELVVNNKAVFLEAKYAPGLDFFAIHFDEIVEEMDNADQ